MIEQARLHYYTSARFEIEPLLPARAARVLEIGSGGGSTIAWLRTRWPDARFTGIEGSRDAAGLLSEHADEAIVADLDQPLPALGQYDLILALDVLEHLKEPRDVLRALVRHLAPGGTVIVSLPNVARLSVSLPLLFGRFRYEDEGILDRTHLRFFTQTTAVELMEDSGLSVDRALVTGVSRGATRLIDSATGGMLRRQLARQFVMRGARGEAGPVKWGRSTF